MALHGVARCLRQLALLRWRSGIDNAGAYLYRAIADDYDEPRIALRARQADRIAVKSAERECAESAAIARRNDENARAARDRDLRAAWFAELPADRHAAMLELAARNAATSAPAMREIQTRIEFAKLVAAAISASVAPISWRGNNDRVDSPV